MGSVAPPSGQGNKTSNATLTSDEALGIIDQEILESCMVKQATLSKLRDKILEAAQVLAGCLSSGGKVLFFGNGGSAADAQHLAAELVVKYQVNRGPLAALALHGNSSVVTAISNDYGYKEIFARQVRAFARPGDVAVGISTSGASPNVLKGLQAAREVGCATIGMTGENGHGLMASFCDLVLAVPSKVTPRIQESHITMGHVIIGLVEKMLFPGV
ncbi:MAG: D-sedoheptulose 7-phosphate isomerase [Bacillota bacterium]|nr:D-sedoheptulose 7-phosphate isomerase [Bacillota bacterium]